MQALLENLKAIHPISSALEKHLAKTLQYKAFKKDHYLLKAGVVSSHIYFIASGLVRSFYEKEEAEINSWFFAEGDIIISVQSFYTREAGSEYLQALEPTETWYVSYDELQFIYHNYPEFNFIARVLTEKYYALSEQRLFAMRKQSAVERYNHLLQNSPQLVQRVSSKYLASYLGVSAETLSRIKKK
jgi:CRP/FNR family transcriptional regulator, anaerobic regulatory protein